jgi:hypothetical protein
MKPADDVLLMNDQPVTCPNCGCRTAWDEIGKQQLHLCLNELCNHSFVVEEDEDRLRK